MTDGFLGCVSASLVTPILLFGFQISTDLLFCTTTYARASRFRLWHLPSGLSLCKWVGWWSFKKDREEASNASLAISLDVSAQFFFCFFFFETFIENIREKPKIMEACDWFYMFHCVKDHSVLLWHLIQSGAWQAQIHAMWTYGACFFLLCSSCSFNHYL